MSVRTLIETIRNAAQRVTVGATYYDKYTPSINYKVMQLALHASTKKPIVVYTDGTTTWTQDLDLWQRDIIGPTHRNIGGRFNTE